MRFLVFLVMIFFWLNFVRSEIVNDVNNPKAKSTFFKRPELSNKIYYGGLLEEVHAEMAPKCASRCHGNERCIHILYNTVSGKCRLYGHNDGNMMEESGWEYWGTSRDAVCDKTEKWTRFSGQCTLLQDCSDILAADSSAPDGIYTIRPTVDTGSIDVYCDMTNNGGGWMVFQRRMDGSENFYRNRTDYRDGFGELTREFWLGNMAINRITNQKSYTLRVDLKDFSSNQTHAVYTDFYIGNESDNFRLNFSNYSGTAGDSLSYHKGMNFSTWDKDDDQSSGNCADRCAGGWWYNKCYHSNLNGSYNVTRGLAKIYWRSWRECLYPLKSITMKIRPP